MRKSTLLLVLLLICLPMAMIADSRINLTPLPKSITTGTGTLTLPQSFTIVTGELPDSLSNEAVKFATLFEKVTGYTVDVKKSADDALITMSLYNGNEQLGCEGYYNTGNKYLCNMLKWFLLCIPECKEDVAGKCDGRG